MITSLCMHVCVLLFMRINVITHRAAPILVSVSVSGQYQHILMVSESVKYIIQVPILLFVQYYP